MRQSSAVRHVDFESSHATIGKYERHQATPLIEDGTLFSFATQIISAVYILFVFFVAQSKSSVG